MTAEDKRTEPPAYQYVPPAPATQQDREDLAFARGAVVIAALLACMCPVLRRLVFEMTSEIPHFGWVWVGWALVTMLAFYNKTPYTAEQAARLINHKYVAVGVSAFGSIVLWFVPAIIDALGLTGWVS